MDVHTFITEMTYIALLLALSLELTLPQYSQWWDLSQRLTELASDTGRELELPALTQKIFPTTLRAILKGLSLSEVG